MIYNIIIYIIQPILYIQLLWRSRKLSGYRHRWSERYGLCKGKVKSGGIVIHSVSVGETLTAVPLVNALKYYYPLLPITITTITPTGSQQVLSIFGKDVYHVYLPYDLPGSIKRFLNEVNPKLFIVMETEIWPNLIKSLYQRNIPLVIANARLSAQSLAGYKIFKRFIARIMQYITLVAAQYEDDGAKFLELGLKKSQLVITGNLKFEISITSSMTDKAIKLRDQWAPNRFVWIAASTHDGEEKILLRSHRQLLNLFPDLLLILVPRHPERFLIVRNITIKYGFNYIMRSSGKIPSSNTQVLILDTIGELRFLYGVADIAFIGGSLVAHGGHNPLEAAVYAIPILIGIHTFNFSNIYRMLNENCCLITVTDVASLVSSISQLLKDKNYRFKYGRNALKVFLQNQGSIQKLLNILKPYLL